MLKFLRSCTAHLTVS